MKKIICINSECCHEFEVNLQEGAGAKQVQCPRCYRFFFVRKTVGKITSFEIDIANTS